MRTTKAKTVTPGQTLHVQVHFIYVLKKRDLSSVGGPMGSEKVRTMEEWFCTSLDKAKSLAVHDYAMTGGRETLEWEKAGAYYWSSQDLVSFQYEIYKNSVHNDPAPLV